MRVSRIGTVDSDCRSLVNIAYCFNRIHAINHSVIMSLQCHNTDFEYKAHYNDSQETTSPYNFAPTFMA